MAETLFTLSIISFVIAGVALVVAVFFWFLFKIPSVIGDLSGRTARKSIAKMRASNEKTGSKGYRESKVNVSRGKITGTMPDSAKISQTVVPAQNNVVGTEVLVENRAESHTTEGTSLLYDENATAPLEVQYQGPLKRQGGKKLIMLEEVMFIHTEETI